MIPPVADSGLFSAYFFGVGVFLVMFSSVCFSTQAKSHGEGDVSPWDRVSPQGSFPPLSPVWGSGF